MSLLAVAAPLKPRRSRWTVDEFHELSQLPIFEHRRMILVDGEVLDMPPANHAHDVGLGACQQRLAEVFDAKSYWLRVQMALPMGKWSDPVPDLAVVAGPLRSHSKQPTTALLVVEVSDSSLDYDIGDKAELYAAGSIQEYWVVDLNGRKLIVFRDPGADPDEPSRHRYRTRLELDASATVAPLAAGSTAIPVAELF